jgi:hypothetical protein
MNNGNLWRKPPFRNLAATRWRKQTIRARLIHGFKALSLTAPRQENQIG